LLRWLGGVGAMGVAVASAVSCRQPTEITIHVLTNLGCPGASGDTLASTSIDAASNTTRTTQCSAGSPYNEVGTLVVVPGPSGDGYRVTVSVAGAARLNGAPAPDSDACLAQGANTSGCIVTTRSLSFISHAALDLPIVIDSRCANVTCKADETCVAGVCVSQCADCDGGVDAADEVPPTSDGGEAAAAPLDVTGLAAQGDGTCAVLNPDGHIVCWGSDSGGRFGQPPSTTSALPTPVPNVTNVAKLVLGADFACALDRAGAITCWGANANGQLGDGTTTPHLTPAPIFTIAASLKFTDLAAGAQHACAVTSAGNAYCWGDNSSHQIDGVLGSPLAKPTALTSNATYRFESISAGVSHTCGVVDDRVNTVIQGAVLCWGASDAALGKSGGGTTLTPTLNYAGNTLLTYAGAVSCGEHFTTADVGVDGAVYGWGQNLSGQVNPKQLSSTPVAPGNYLQPAYFYWDKSGGGFACGLDGIKSQLYCWGDSSAGQIGTTTGAGPNQVAVGAVKLAQNPLVLATGSSHGCVVTTGTDGDEVWCWGKGSAGQLGVSSTSLTNGFTTTPVRALP
jgi:alpha-tubulin suppressor-like RCC1 family protein